MDNGLISRAQRAVNGFFGRGNPAPAGPHFSNYIPKPNGTKIENSMVVDSSGMGGASDFGFNADISAPQLINPAQAQRIVETLYYTDWQSQKIIDLPVEDMLREPWEYIAADDRELNEKLWKYSEGLNLQKVLRQALAMERLYGGSVIFMGIRDSIDDPAIPLDPSTVGPGDLMFLNPISRYKISSVLLQLDPTKPGYGKPEFYLVFGHKVHRSRLLIFDGSPIQPLREGVMPVIYNMIQDGFGYPMLLRIRDDLVRATGSRQAAFQLINRASILFLTGDLQTAAAFKDSEGNIQALQSIVNSVSMYKAAILNSVPGAEASLQNLSANFGAIPELIMTFLQIVSSSCDIPATRYLGRSPAGMNSTGESDLENYYNMIEARQRQDLKPQLEKLLPIMTASSGTTNVDTKEIEIEFKPLWNATELEDAQTREININSILTLVNGGIIGSKEAVDELKQRKLLITNPLDYPKPELPVGGQVPTDEDVKGSIDKIGEKDASDAAK